MYTTTPHCTTTAPLFYFTAPHCTTVHHSAPVVMDLHWRHLAAGTLFVLAPGAAGVGFVAVDPIVTGLEQIVYEEEKNINIYI